MRPAYNEPKWMKCCCPSGSMGEDLWNTLTCFSGENWKQEDDINMILVNRLPDENSSSPQSLDPEHPIAAFSLPSEAGSERIAVKKVTEAVQPLGISEIQTERIMIAVAETTMNAIEHGNHFEKDKLVEIELARKAARIVVRITDQGGSQPIPEHTEPDLEAKLAGRQSTRGWGLFLIRHMVDEMAIFGDELHHTVELVFSLEGTTHGSPTG